MLFITGFRCLATMSQGNGDAKKPLHLLSSINWPNTLLIQQVMFNLKIEIVVCSYW
jgi:hypothetical protein